MADLNRSSELDGAPPTDRRLMALAAFLLVIPIVALLWVSSYARETPRLWGFPFFFWYQFLWVFICAGLTYSAHRLVLAARKPRSGISQRDRHVPGTGSETDEGGRR